MPFSGAALSRRLGRGGRSLGGRGRLGGRSLGLGGGLLGLGGCSAAGCLGGGLLGLGRRVIGGRRGSALADLRQDGADLDGLVLLDEDLLDHSAHGRRDLGVDLVGRDLQQSFVRLYGVADLLEPAGDRSLGDALAERGEDHGSAHVHVSFRMPMSFLA